MQIPLTVAIFVYGKFVAAFHTGCLVFFWIRKTELSCASAYERLVWFDAYG